jgi:hypothetical protein
MADMCENWERRRYIALSNRATGKGVVIDMYKKRLALMRYRISTWAKIMTMLKSEVDTRMVMIDLTYRGVEDYRPGHINDYVKKLKQSVGKNLYGFAWVAELQQRGAVHYHLVLVVKKGSRIPVPDKSGMWKHGMSKIGTAKTPYYLLVYTGKEAQKDLARYPKSCRLYSASLRLPEGRTRDFYSKLRELEKISFEVAKFEAGYSSGEWIFNGACVTRGYAEKVLIPSDCIVK